MPEFSSEQEALVATGKRLLARYAIDPDAFAHAARKIARAAWRAGPFHSYCLSIGMSSIEGLWAPLELGEGAVGRLNDWLGVIRNALVDHDQISLADTLLYEFPEVVAEWQTVLSELERLVEAIGPIDHR